MIYYSRDEIVALLDKHFPVAPDIDFCELALFDLWGGRAVRYLSAGLYAFNPEARWAFWRKDIFSHSFRFRTEADAMFAALQKRVE